MMLIARLHIQYPMLFKLTNNRAHRVTHCGVLEFVADEGRVYLPYWVMHALLTKFLICLWSAVTITSSIELAFVALK